ncbi:flagellar brake domain-containing protein [Domibacillus sp. A3M-37]|uniref:flagellar brake protein n=1 Tax=Domibacillus sp. A3M-37 TaxID=2962037 RepID=UPI0020B7DE47|nr:flagellar brake domain-containing protein [Domibacillus sp. A3M-37]MCP3763213.1 flagellar brake domain-containing protein [Domibacillus sp. A3M-37]
MLEPGRTITMEPFDGNDKKEEYRCKVVDIEEGKLFIDYPVSVQTNRTVFLLDGMQLAVSFIDPAASSAIFLFHTEVIGRVKKEIPMLMLHDPGLNNYVRVQRRKFVRVQKAVDVAVEVDGMPSFSSVTEDISAGGMAIVLPESAHADKGTEAKVYGVIPSQHTEPRYIEAMAELVRIYEDKKSGRRVGSFQFKDLVYAEQQMLMRFCFEQQLQLRKKGVE